MQIFSQDLKDGQKMPEKHVFNGMGYQGENISPQLSWQNAPAATQSFVVTCFDPDAPTGSGWWHWVIANIPANCCKLEQGAGSAIASLPTGAVQTRTDFGQAGYGGAAPPAGRSHRYVFTIHALDCATIEVDSQSSGAMVGFHVFAHSLASASLTVTFN